MKLLLVLSIFLNIVLGFRLYQNSQKPALERIVIENKIVPHLPEPLPREEVKEVVPKVTVTNKAKAAKPKEGGVTHYEGITYEMPGNDQEWQDEIDKIENARNNFFEKENIDPEMIKKVRKLKKEFREKQQAIYSHEFPGELSLERRKAAIMMEEKYQKDAQGLMGKENWIKFQKFKENYNQSLYKNLKVQDGSPRAFLPMDL